MRPCTQLVWSCWRWPHGGLPWPGLRDCVAHGAGGGPVPPAWLWFHRERAEWLFDWTTANAMVSCSERHALISMAATMNTLIFSTFVSALAAAGWAGASPAAASPTPSAAAATPSPERDGSAAFDWELGVWDTQLRRLRQPLSGKTEWIDYAGTTVVTPLAGRRANIVELDVRGAAGRIAGVSLRLFQPATQQWTLHFANLANGLMTNPMSGSFQGGRGTFYGDETVDGRTVKVRFVITPLSPVSWRFEQAYSSDNGQSWEMNWIAVDTRRGPVAPGPMATEKLTERTAHGPH